LQENKPHFNIDAQPDIITAWTSYHAVQKFWNVSKLTPRSTVLSQEAKSFWANQILVILRNSECSLLPCAQKAVICP
jgi:hypothetical protein